MVNVHIDDIIPEDVSAQAIRDRQVTMRSHPDYDLNILNYGKTVAWENAWNEATLNCRGLVIDGNGYVVARPFRKFFNYGQDGAPTIGLDDEIVATDKADGSLGILVPTDDGYIIATRGSFTSEQAIWATEKWRSTYDLAFIPNPDWTYLFEIVYEANRIVLDYAGMEDLILLGAVETETGRSVPLDQVVHNGPFPSWPGPTVLTLPYKTLREALEAPPRPNAEGMVIWHPATDSRVKIKQDSYLRLHRIVSNLNEKTVWEHLVSGLPLDELTAELPDEFLLWVRQYASSLEAEVASRASAIESLYETILGGLPEGWSRKDFAAAASAHGPLAPFLFSVLDGHDCRPRLLQALKPSSVVQE